MFIKLHTILKIRRDNADCSGRPLLFWQRWFELIIVLPDMHAKVHRISLLQLAHQAVRQREEIGRSPMQKWKQLRHTKHSRALDGDRGLFDVAAESFMWACCGLFRLRRPWRMILLLTVMTRATALGRAQWLWLWQPGQLTVRTDIISLFWSLVECFRVCCRSTLRIAS